MQENLSEIGLRLSNFARELRGFRRIFWRGPGQFPKNMVLELGHYPKSFRRVKKRLLAAEAWVVRDPTDTSALANAGTPVVDYRSGRGLRFQLRRVISQDRQAPRPYERQAPKRRAKRTAALRAFARLPWFRSVVRAARKGELFGLRGFGARGATEGDVGQMRVVDAFAACSV